MKYLFSIPIFTKQTGDTEFLYPSSITFTGEIEADRSSFASTKAWALIHAECARIKESIGLDTATGDLHMQAESEVACD